MDGHPLAPRVIATAPPTEQRIEMSIRTYQMHCGGIEMSKQPSRPTFAPEVQDAIDQFRLDAERSEDALLQSVPCHLLALTLGRSEGLEWPINGLELDPMARIGTSNRATGPLRLEADGPGLLVILPRARLADVVAALV